MNVSPRYDIGRPKLVDVWVDPAHGDDARSGRSRGEALRTLSEMWRHIPEETEPTGAGVRVMLCPGKHAHDSEQLFHFEHRTGTFDCPIIIQPADGPLSAEVPALGVRWCQFLYFLDLKVATPGDDGNAVHNYVMWMADSRDVLIRGVTGVGLVSPGGRLPMLVIKASQCLRVYIEDCDFSGARENAIDYVAVQYGHIVRNRLHHTFAECMYVKGGSAHHLIAGNEMFDSVNHGVLAGQTTGFRYMVSPYLHYEAYDIKVVNNVIHDCGGGVATAGGYNILLAWNTCWRVGTSRDTIVAGLGGRAWGHGDITPLMREYLDAGGWCRPDGELAFNIPNRNVTIANNVICNPDGFTSRHAHFGISGPVETTPDSNIPSPARADDNLVVRGNVIWNGGADMPVLDDVEDVYHLAARPTVEAATLVAENAINTVRPELVDPEHGDFRPAPGGNLYRQRAAAIDNFDWTDAPARPPVPPGNPDNRVTRDRDGNLRGPDAPPGAYA